MSIYRYKNYLDFIKNERKTLKFLKDDPCIQNTSFSGLSSSADECYFGLPTNDKKLSSSNLEFACHFDILVENKIRKVIIECVVRPNFELVSYVLSICENNQSPLSLIRKFHFDYAQPISNQSPKPLYHLQYGGKATPLLRELNIDADVLYDWLSIPRLHFYPINLALLLDIVFQEFKSDETIKVVERTEWRNLIKENEDMLLKPFYNSFSSFFSSGHKSTNLIRDFYSPLV